MRFKDLAQIWSIRLLATRDEFGEICAFKSEIRGIHEEPQSYIHLHLFLYPFLYPGLFSQYPFCRIIEQ